jgi:hypothetical protein
MGHGSVLRSEILTEHYSDPFVGAPNGTRVIHVVALRRVVFVSGAGDLHVKKEVPAEWNSGLSENKN